MSFDHTYAELLECVLGLDGIDVEDRTGTGARSIFGYSFDVRSTGLNPVPLLGLKTTNWSSVIEELRWFLSGATNINDLHSKIWAPWAKPDGEIGPMYGSQWRSWGGRGIDQVQSVIDSLQARDVAADRRLCVSAWNVADLPSMALAPCHPFWQVRRYNNRLHMAVYQRSADILLGLPFNVFSYYCLLNLLAAETNLRIGDLHYTLGDAHIYSNHLEAAKIVVDRQYEYNGNPMLRVIGSGPGTIQRFIDGELVLDVTNYDPMPHIKLEVAI